MTIDKVRGPALTDAGLDRLAEQLFVDEPRRLEPLLARFNQEVGHLRDDDKDLRLLQAIRTDWALCDAPCGAMESLQETWATRVARGLVPGVDPSMGQAAAQTHAGVFEVFAGPSIWIRDPLRGSAYRLLDPVAPFADSAGTPAGVWELRVLYDRDADGVHMLRSPLRYPRDVARQLAATHIDRFARPPRPDLQALRKAYLHWSRSGERFWRL